MASKIRLITLAVMAIAALLLVACGSSAATNRTTGPSDSPAPAAAQGDIDPAFASSGIEVLNRSATTFAGQITSVTGALQFSFDAQGLALTGKADFAYQAPDQMHMSMNFDGGDQQSLLNLSEVGTFELLARDGSVYMKIPALGGWYSFTPEDLGTSQAELQRMLSRGSMFDYAGFLQKLTQQVTYVGQEDVDGHSTAHYQFTGQLSDLIASFADALGSTGDSGLSSELTNSPVDGPVTMDIWVGTDDYLPYKITATAGIYTGAGKLQMSLAGTFSGYNQPVTIPDTPADAKPVSQAFGGGATATP